MKECEFDLERDSESECDSLIVLETVVDGNVAIVLVKEPLMS